MRLLATPTSDEWLFITVIFFLVGMLIASAELIRRMLNGSSDLTRKFVHIIAGILMMCSPFVFHSGIPVLIITALTVVGTFFTRRSGLLNSLHAADRDSYGTTYHPLSFFILVLLFWDSSPMILAAAISILAIPDALAAFAGQYRAQPHVIEFDHGTKTVEGMVTMFVTTFLTLWGVFLFFGTATSIPMLIVIFTVSCFVTGWELISFKGTDNLTVPLGAAFMLHYFLTAHPLFPSEQLATAVILGITIGAFSFYFNFLSLSGSVATFLLATVIYGIGGWMWTIPIFTFFMASSLLSKYGKAKKKKLELVFDKSSKRDAGQVAANGGPAGLLIILWYLFPERTEIYFLYVASIAAVTADTWGTEIGTLFKRRPRSIITFKTVDVGTSGGVSSAGFIGGIFGAALVVATVSLFPSSGISAGTAAILILSGAAGSAVDSLLGATVQALYKTEKGKMTERTEVNGVRTNLVRGFRWMSNDLVNWCCGTAGAATAYFLL